MDNQRGKAERDLEWLAGIFEGEGCFSLDYSSRATQPRSGIQIIPRIILTNTDHSMVDEALRILHSHDVDGFVETKLTQGRKPCYNLTLHGMKRVKRLLELVQPYLRTGNKQADAQDLREFVESRLSKERKAPYSDRELWLFFAMRERHGHASFGILRDLHARLRRKPDEDKVQPSVKADGSLQRVLRGLQRVPDREQDPTAEKLRGG